MRAEISSDLVENILRSTQARKLANLVSIQEITFEQTLSDVLFKLESCDSVLIRGYSKNEHEKSASHARGEPSDALFSRHSLLPDMAVTKNLMKPVSLLFKNKRPVECVAPAETLDVVVSKMVESGSEVIGVIDQSVVRGVVTCAAITAFIRQECPSVGNFGVDRQDIQGMPPNVLLQRDDNDNDDDDDDDDNGFDLMKEKPRAPKSHFTESQLAAQSFSRSWCCELLIALCLLLDMSIAISDLVQGSDSTAVSDRAMVATGCLLAIYIYESVVRFYAFRQEIFNRKSWLLDFAIVAISAAIYIVVLSDALPNQAKNSATLMRGMRLVRFVLILRRLQLAQRLRRTISSQKTRYKRDGFDLDLTYITPTCVAMSLPALGAEAGFRNPMAEVRRFFDTMHPGNYTVFNLCAERAYDPALLGGRVERIPVADHNPPRLAQLAAFVERAGALLDVDREACIAVHCKGGKGRTGVFICAWLVYSGFSASADDAMAWFADRRTGTGARAAQGVSQPSQRRYVRYLEAALRAGGYPAPALTLCRVVVVACPRGSGGIAQLPGLTVEQDGRVVLDSRAALGPPGAWRGVAGKDAWFELDLAVQGDVRVCLHRPDPAADGQQAAGEDGGAGGGGGVGLFGGWLGHGGKGWTCFSWVHTGYVVANAGGQAGCAEIEPLRLCKEEVDVACHDKRCRIFSADFALELHFRAPPDECDGGGCDGWRRIIPAGEGLVHRSRGLRRRMDRPDGIWKSSSERQMGAFEAEATTPGSTPSGHGAGLARWPSLTSSEFGEGAGPFVSGAGKAVEAVARSMPPQPVMLVSAQLLFNSEAADSRPGGSLTA